MNVLDLILNPQTALAMEDFVSGRDKMRRDVEGPRGFSVVGVIPNPGEFRPPFSYTVGLTKMGLPEVIVYGVPSQIAGQILNDLVDLHLEGTTLIQHGAAPFVSKGPSGDPWRVELTEVGRWAIDEYLCQAKFWAEDVGLGEISALQLTLCDINNLLPWEPGFDEEYMSPRQLCLTPTREWSSR